MNVGFLSFLVSQQRNLGVIKDRLSPYLEQLLPFSRKEAHTDRNFQSTEVV